MMINESDFQKEVLDSEIPVLVDFFADWCVPCKMLAPTLAEISDEMEGKAKILKINIDESEETVIKYGIKSIPTLLFFKSGEVVDSIIGLVPKEDIVSKLDNLL